MTKVLAVVAATVLLASCGRESKGEYFKRLSRQYTESSCPNHFTDGITTLDSLVFDDSDDEGTQNLYYSLEVDSATRQAILDKKNELTQANLDFVRNSVVFAKQKEEGVRFRFIYYDAEKKDKIIDCTYTKKDYQ